MKMERNMKMHKEEKVEDDEMEQAGDDGSDNG